MVKRPIDPLVRSEKTTGPMARVLDALGILTTAGGALAAVLLLLEAPFDGPWVVVAAVAAVFTGLYAGFLAMGFAANLRVLAAIQRLLARRANME